MNLATSRDSVLGLRNSPDAHLGVGVLRVEPGARCCILYFRVSFLFRCWHILRFYTIINYKHKQQNMKELVLDEQVVPRPPLELPALHLLIALFVVCALFTLIMLVLCCWCALILHLL